MNEKELMMKIKKYDFALKELNLYLDTHPNCRKALELFKKYKALKEEAGYYDFSILDIHAEATGEKLAIGYGYDGKINIIFGTHTHVKTADLQILPHGTGYITDVGMCGGTGGVVERMRTRLPKKFVAAPGEPKADGVIFTLDESSGKVTATESISF